ncbi:MAG: IS3 family transposase [Bacteroidota bacterium]|nr:IS3 family transposase [Bacteroidota bacterium]
MNKLFKVLNISKQSFHQMLKRRKFKNEEKEQLIPLINEVRQAHPRMACRDIYLKLKPSCMGRDQFERFCMESGYRIKKLRNYRVTTNSLGVTRFPNLLKNIIVTHVNQVFVSDITYYEIGLKTYYLTFIMDLYNREIVGWSVSDNLRTESTTIPALMRLITIRGSSNLKGAILHSDGGGQYYCDDFKKLIKNLEMKSSMTEEKVYENSHAERLNGIIKNNYLYPWGPTSFESLKNLLDRAVINYNTDKPHMALKKLTPIEFKFTIKNEDNSSSNLPFLTVKPINLKIKKRSQKTVNVF